MQDHSLLMTCGAAIIILSSSAACAPPVREWDTGVGGDASGSGDAASSGPVSTSSSAGGGNPATCDTYCADIVAKCTGEYAQYPDISSCKGACLSFPPGKTGDMAGDSLACRAYHAAAATTSQATHCPHAGPTGGDKDVSDVDGPVCGEGCEAFCAIALKACATQKTYADASLCMADCRAFKPSLVEYSAVYYADMNHWSDDFGCRMYHLSTAAVSAESANAHCQHIVGASTACTK